MIQAKSKGIRQEVNEQIFHMFPWSNASNFISSQGANCLLDESVCQFSHGGCTPMNGK